MANGHGELAATQHQQHRSVGQGWAMSGQCTQGTGKSKTRANNTVITDDTEMMKKKTDQTEGHQDLTWKILQNRREKSRALVNKNFTVSSVVQRRTTAYMKYI